MVAGPGPDPLAMCHAEHAGHFPAEITGDCSPVAFLGPQEDAHVAGHEG